MARYRTAITSRLTGQSSFSGSTWYHQEATIYYARIPIRGGSRFQSTALALHNRASDYCGYVRQLTGEHGQHKLAIVSRTYCRARAPELGITSHRPLFRATCFGHSLHPIRGVGLSPPSYRGRQSLRRAQLAGGDRFIARAIHASRGSFTGRATYAPTRVSLPQSPAIMRARV